MKHIAAIIFALYAVSAHADEWTGQDKAKHVAVGADIATAVTVATDSELYGFLAGASVGAAK